MADIAVFGANGTIGSRIVEEALRRSHRVTAVVRDPATITRTGDRLTVATGDVLDPASVAEAAKGKDVLVSAVGGGDGAGHRALIEPSARALVEGLRRLGADAPRLIMVGGAGSLRTPVARRSGTPPASRPPSWRSCTPTATPWPSCAASATSAGPASARPR
ncbi:NAD(P)-dependent oxidoreductase [Nocardiopsis composta]